MRLPNVKGNSIFFLKHCGNVKELNYSAPCKTTLYFISPFSWNESWSTNIEKIDFPSDGIITEEVFTYSEPFLKKKNHENLIAWYGNSKRRWSLCDTACKQLIPEIQC